MQQCNDSQNQNNVCFIRLGQFIYGNGSPTLPATSMVSLFIGILFAFGIVNKEFENENENENSNNDELDLNSKWKSQMWFVRWILNC